MLRAGAFQCFDDGRRGVPISQGKELHAHAHRLQQLALVRIDRGQRIAASLHVDIRLRQPQEFDGIGVRKNANEINGFKRGNQFRAILLRHDWPALSFQRTNAVIAGDSDQQRSAQSPRPCERLRVANMQDVEAAISDHQRQAISFERVAPGGQSFERDDFGIRDHAFQSLRKSLAE